MDAVQAVIDAVVQGAATATTEIMSDACKRAYARLKDILAKGRDPVVISQKPFPNQVRFGML